MTGLSREGPPAAAARILVVEDERVVAMGLRLQLQSLGYEVVGLATAGPQAVRLAFDLSPDLVLMDIRLEGEMDGVAAAAEIRGRSGPPVVYLTAYSTAEVLDRAKVTEPYGYILKPYEERELHVVIETALYKHRTERALADRERWFAATLRSIGDGVIATDRAGRVTFLNSAAERLTGWPQAEAAGRELESVFRIVHHGTRQPVDNPLPRAIREGAGVPLADNTALVARDGTETPIDDCASPIYDERGCPLGGVMVFRDVSDRYEAEQKAAGLAAIIENSRDAVIGVGLDGTITSWYGGAQGLYGYRAEEVLGKPLAVLAPPGRGEDWGAVVAGLRRGERLATFDALRRHRDGGDLDVMVSVSPVRDRDGRVVGAAAIARDVGHVRRLEEQVRQAQKMEAIGRLAGGVAHDFNNLLTVITGYCHVLFGMLPAHHPARAVVAEVAKAGDRAAGLTQQLLAYSRKQIQQLRVVNVNDLLADTGRMLGRLIGEDVELATDLAPDLRSVRADPGQIGQVIMNLAVNARDAMPTGGRLVIATRNVSIAGGDAAHPEVPPGDYVVLAVSDTGTGMDPATRAHLFEPFFTTKGPGKGTGLGLATVYGVVKQSGGYIEVDSEPGRGATFRVYLPAADGRPAAAVPPPDPAPMPRGGETVLLVEDEESVRVLVRHVLAGCGYAVLEAGDGPEALRLAATHPGPIHLLVSDVVMPQMGGRQLAEKVLGLRPGVRVLFLSGYTDDAVVRHGVREGEVAFLKKPFAPADLAVKVREALDAKGGR